MEKGLLIKVLGKADAVRLEDQIYNLRGITSKVRYGLMGNMSIFDDNFIADVVKALEGINEEIKENIVQALSEWERLRRLRLP